jgi:Glycosyl hydrolase catalytic core
VVVWLLAGGVVGAEETLPRNLPAAMLVQRRWEPLSLSLAAFGQLKLTADSISWASSSSDYRVIELRDDGAALLRLTAQRLPSFNGTTYRYVRLQAVDEDKHLVVSLYKEGDDTSADAALSATYFKPKPVVVIPKRGLAGWTGGTAATASAWYYNWWIGPDNKAGPRAQFVPMVKHAKEVTDHNLENILRLKESQGVTCLLGFNEPERKSQGDITVAEAVRLWPRLMATGLRLGSPAPSADADGMRWLDQFMAQADRNQLRVDFIALHWYQDTAAPTAPDNFVHWLQGIYRRYHRPIWITEFAGINWDRSHPRITSELNQRFMATLLPELERMDIVERYAWFSAGGEASLFADTKTWTLTPLGETYRSIGGLPRGEGAQGDERAAEAP